MKTHGPWKTLQTEVGYESPWIRVDHSEVLNPAGNPGTYSVVHFKNIAIGIIPIDEEGNTWLVGQYRYPLKEYSWEIPEGGGDPNIDPIESAQRELLEETGIKAKNWKLINTMHLSNSASDELALIYLATDLSFHKSSPEETEELEIKKIKLTDFFTQVDSGEITDSLTVAAAQKVELMLLKNEF
ncbi:MAG: ADP-ribose pyrophosphatase [Parvicellaceae bacterium]|jgi:ADP-ribose pyrophosphatase